MQYGVLLAGDDLQTWRRNLQAVRDGGFWGIGLGDSQSLYPDPYVQATVAAFEAPGLHVGPWVSNPVTRHPAVTARALHSVDVLTQGRAFLGIGIGDSAVRNLGLKPASLDELERYVVAVRGLLREGRGNYQGADIPFKEASRPIPIYMAASGPKGLQLAGRIADGVIVGAGLEPHMVQRAKQAIADGAEAAGRDIAELDLWWPVVASLAPDDAEARSRIRAHLITFAHFGLGRLTEWNGVPTEHHAALAEVQRRYRPINHAQSAAGSHAELADELGLTDFLAERFAVAGTPATVLARIAELEGRGIDRMWVSLRVADKLPFLQQWSAEVAPALQPQI
jgi:5,10-methylenetetrahydromethanopterin reductase